MARRFILLVILLAAVGTGLGLALTRGAAAESRPDLATLVQSVRADLEAGPVSAKPGQSASSSATVSDAADILAWLMKNPDYGPAHPQTVQCLQSLELDEIGDVLRETPIGDVRNVDAVLRQTGNCYLAGNPAPPTTTTRTQADASLPNPWRIQDSTTIAELSGIFFLNPNEGWLAGGEAPSNSGGVNSHTVVRHTLDGGNHWLEDAGAKAAELLTLHHELKKVFAVGFHVWIIGEGCDNNPEPCDFNESVIIHSSNGGKTWTQQAHPSCFDIESIFMFDALHGIIGTTCSFFLTTSNGGNTWTSATTSSYCGSTPSDSIWFPPSNKPWFQREGWAADCGIFHTTDGGQTWTEQTVDGSLGTCCWEQLYAVDVNHVMAVREFPSTNDVARYNPISGTWTTMAVRESQAPNNCSPGLQQIVGLDAGNWYVLGESCNDDSGASMFKTGNGGATWVQVTPPGGTAQRDQSNSAFTLDSRHAWSVGGSGGVIAYNR